jgi:hypothetical protein
MQEKKKGKSTWKFSIVLVSVEEGLHTMLPSYCLNLWYRV